MPNSFIDQQAAGQKVAEFIGPIIAEIVPGQRTGYFHMGATLTDTTSGSKLSVRRSPTCAASSFCIATSRHDKPFPGFLACYRST